MTLSTPLDKIFSAVSLKSTLVTGYELSNDATGFLFLASHNFMVLSSEAETKSSGPLLAPGYRDNTRKLE